MNCESVSDRVIDRDAEHVCDTLHGVDLAKLPAIPSAQQVCVCGGGGGGAIPEAAPSSPAFLLRYSHPASDIVKLQAPNVLKWEFTKSGVTLAHPFRVGTAGEQDIGAIVPVTVEYGESSGHGLDRSLLWRGGVFRR